MLYNARNGVVTLFDDYSTIAFEPKYISIHWRGHKIVTPKQIFQKLLIAIAQVKAGNRSDNLLSEIRKIIYSL